MQNILADDQNQQAFIKMMYKDKALIIYRAYRSYKFRENMHKYFALKAIYRII